jgi:hypothetical protein
MHHIVMNAESASLVIIHILAIDLVSYQIFVNYFLRYENIFHIIILAKENEGYSYEQYKGHYLTFVYTLMH